MHEWVRQESERDSLSHWPLRAGEPPSAQRTRKETAPAKQQDRRNLQFPNCAALRQSLHWVPANSQTTVSETELHAPGERWLDQLAHWPKYAPFRYFRKKPHEPAAPPLNNAFEAVNQFLYRN